jgi:hypothetical protein
MRKTEIADWSIREIALNGEALLASGVGIAGINERVRELLPVARRC